MLINIDDREDNVLVKELGEMEIMCFPKRLKTGDYVWEEGSVCIERKTVDDFCLSIMDGRLKKQVEKMKKEFTYCYIVVSGRIKDKKTEINENVVVGMYVSLVVRQGMKVIWVDDDRQCAFVIKRILERHKEMKDEKDK